MPASPLYLPTIAPSTVDQAINAMIVAGGEGPIAGSVVHRPDREAAASLLDEALRECLTEGWSFNTEHGLEIQNTATIEWLGSDNTTATLNIFVPPTNLLSFKVTQSREQADLDFVVRPPRDWLGGPLVFYDRVLNRDGYADRTSLYIDPTWLMDYEDLPQTARNVVFLRALRRFLAQIVGDLAASDRKERDEVLAYRHLKREFGNEDRFNLFGNLTTARHFGYRFFDQSTVDDRRGNRSGAVGGAGYRTTTSVSINPASFTLSNIELDEALQVPASITLRRTNLTISLTNPNSGNVAQVVVNPNPVTLLLQQPLSVPQSVTLSGTSVNLLAPTDAAELVSTVAVTPNPFTILSTAPIVNENNIVLISNNVILRATPDGFSTSLNFAGGFNAVYPGNVLNGTVTINRLGDFAGSVTLSSTDPRIAFPSGSTALPGQTTVPFTYTAPANAATGSFSGQIVGTATGLPQVASSYSVQIGIPFVDFSTGIASQNFNKGFITQAAFSVTRTNYNGPITVTANVPMNVAGFDEKQTLRTIHPVLLDVQGNGAIVTSRIPNGANGFTVIPSGVSATTIFVEVTNALSGTSGSFQVTITGDGTTPVTKTISFTTGGSGGTGDATVSTVQLVPNPFTLISNSGASPVPASITIGSASATLSMS